MISYLGSLIQFTPATGRVGHCRQILLCVDSIHCVTATLGLPRTGVSLLSPSTLLRLGCSIWSGSCVECGSSFQVVHKSTDSVAPVFCAFPGLSSSGSQRLGRPLPGCGKPFPSAATAQTAGGLRALSSDVARLFPPGPQRARPVGSQEVFRQEPGPVCSVGGGGFSGAEFPLSPPPCLLPPAWMGRLFSGVSQSLCFANHH